jgi:hypothetical protein
MVSYAGACTRTSRVRTPAVARGPHVRPASTHTAPSLNFISLPTFFSHRRSLCFFSTHELGLKAISAAPASRSTAPAQLLLSFPPRPPPYLPRHGPQGQVPQGRHGCDVHGRTRGRRGGRRGRREREGEALRRGRRQPADAGRSRERTGPDGTQGGGSGVGAEGPGRERRGAVLPGGPVRRRPHRREAVLQEAQGVRHARARPRRDRRRPPAALLPAMQPVIKRPLPPNKTLSLSLSLSLARCLAWHALN